MLPVIESRERSRKVFQVHHSSKNIWQHLLLVQQNTVLYMLWICRILNFRRLLTDIDFGNQLKS